MNKKRSAEAGGSAACRAAASGGRPAPQTGSRRGGRSAALQEASPRQEVVGAETGGDGKRRAVLIHRESRTETTARHSPARRRGGRARAAFPPPTASGPGGADGRSAPGWKERASGEEEGKEIVPLEAHGGSWQYIKSRRLGAGGEVPADLKVQSFVFLSGPPLPANEQQTKTRKKMWGGGGGEWGKEAEALRSFPAVLMELRSVFCSTECLEGDFVEQFSCPSCSCAVDAPRTEQQQRQKKKKKKAGGEKKRTANPRNIAEWKPRRLKFKKIVL